jgi:hypothetical protein
MVPGTDNSFSYCWLPIMSVRVTVSEVKLAVVGKGILSSQCSWRTLRGRGLSAALPAAWLTGLWVIVFFGFCGHFW